MLKKNALLLVLTMLSAGAQAEQVITLPTRPGVTQSYLLLHESYATPTEVAILIPGGNGVIGLATVNGQATIASSGNFLVRSRTMFRDSNLAVAVVDAPSDLQTNAGMTQAFRMGSAHATDIAAVVADLNARFPAAPVYLIGTSNGTISAGYLAAELGSAVQGAILTSSITVDDPAAGPGLSGFDFTRIKAPVLMVGNVNDQCAISPYSGTLQVAQQYGYPLITVNGGLPPTSTACNAMAYHGYYGKEAETVAAIKGWMFGMAYPSVIAAALGTGQDTISPGSLDFGSQPTGAQSTGSAVTLTNTGSAALSIASIAANGDFAVTNNCGYSLAVGGSCRIVASVTPSQAGVGSAQISIYTNNNANSIAQTVSLQANGVTSVPQSGIWWNPAEGGRGFMIEQKGGKIFMASFLYDASGRSTWYGAGPASMNGSTFNAPLAAYAGGQTLTGSYKTPTAAASPGNNSIVFTDATHGTLTWPGGAIPVQRFEFASNGLHSPPTATQPQTGWWWNPSEGGRGFSVEVQNNTAFIATYMYDGNGNPVWYLSGPTALTSDTLYIGSWTSFTGGQTLTGAYQAASGSTPAGSLTIQFATPASGTLTLPDGRQIPIQRFGF